MACLGTMTFRIAITKINEKTKKYLSVGFFKFYFKYNNGVKRIIIFIGKKILINVNVLL